MVDGAGLACLQWGMPLFLSESDVTTLLSMPEAMHAIEEAFQDEALNEPRRRFFLPNGVFHHMAAALPTRGVVGTKTYTSFAGGTRFYIQLFSSETGELLAYLEADRLGQIRTGAATGVAAKFMARPEVERVSLFGTGGQAQTQAEAFLAARPGVREFQVFSRNAAKREAFCRDRTTQFGVPFIPMESAEAAAQNTDALLCATTAREPFLKAEWLSPGAFVAAVGANRLTAQEIESDVLARAALVVVDDKEQAQAESAELRFAVERRQFSWARLETLNDVVRGRVAGHSETEAITVFKSLGVAVEDIAVAALVYEKAKAQGVGREL